MKFKSKNTTTWQNIMLSPSGDTLPIGSITQYGGELPPTGWLICDGSAVSRFTYSELFAVIGTKYGAGNGTTTFNLPDFKERVPVGESDNYALASFGGVSEVVLSREQMPSHTHTQSEHSHSASSQSAGNHNHTGRFKGFNGTSNTSGWYLGRRVVNEDGYDGTWQTTNDAGSHSHTINIGNATPTINSTGGGQPHTNMQPYLVVNFIIKAKQSAGIVGGVSNVESQSSVDTYSCEYINQLKGGGGNASIYIGPDEPEDESYNLWIDDEEVKSGILGGGDNLPVGSEMNYLGDGKNIPIGYEVENDYSTTEQKTGQTWINGKPIYRKVLNLGGVSWTANKTIAHGIENLEMCISSHWLGYYESNSSWYTNWDSLDNVNRRVDTTNIYFSNGAASYFAQNYIILEYTKTTD